MIGVFNMLPKPVNNGPCIIFYETRTSTPTYEVRVKAYKYINIKTKKTHKTMVNIKDLGLTNGIHLNEEVTIKENIGKLKI